MLDIALLPAHTIHWASFQTAMAKQRIPQALLLVGSAWAEPLAFAHRLIATLLCEGASKPCGQCAACQWVITSTHPDVEHIQAEEDQKMLKIESVRQLQQAIYRPPQRGAYRVVLIESAEQLNLAAVNALLKILEEPPAQVIFILVAAHRETLPATLLSRCQRYLFQNPLDLAQHSMDLTTLKCPEAYRQLLTQYDTILASIAALKRGDQTPCQIATTWSTYDFDALLWILSLICIRQIRQAAVDRQASLWPTASLLSGNEKKVSVRRMRGFRTSDVMLWGTDVLEVLFKQLDAVYDLIRKRQRHIQLNQRLALDVFLLGFCHAH